MPDAGLDAVVEMVCDDLTDVELAVLELVAEMDLDPHNRIFNYEKVKPLFTDGMHMHEDTKAALAHIVLKRLYPRG